MSIHDEIEEARKSALPEANQLKEFREYARGRQRATLTPGQAKILRGLLGHIFCDNVCGLVLGELRNRLRLVRFEVADDLVLDYLSDFWTLNKLAELSAAAHWSMLRDGDHAVGLYHEDDRVRLSRENWWDGKSGFFMMYEGGSPSYGVKEWETKQLKRRTVYYADRIERYALQEKGWKPYLLDTDDEQWPQPWTMNGQPDGEPLGLPVVHFRNAQIPNDSSEKKATSPLYGMSELDGGLLGLQDEINDLHRDMSAAARFAGYQMLYGTGITRNYDEYGNSLANFSVEPGAFFEEENPAARFGVLPPGSLAELERALTVKLQAVGRKSGVPMHIIGGDWPSGEALLRAETRLIDKVETIGASVGPAWASVAHKATRLANVFAGLGLDEDELISSVFAPVARRDPITLARIADSRAAHVSRQETLRTLGYAPAEIESILNEMEEEARRFGQMDEAQLVLLRQQIGISTQQALRELGYSEQQVEQMLSEREVQAATVGEELLRAFDGGR